MRDALILAPNLDLKAAAPLQAEILTRRGQALEIDASSVQRLGGLCLTVLLSAQRTWCDDALPLHVINRSPAFDEALSLFGARAKFDEPLMDEMN